MEASFCQMEPCKKCCYKFRAVHLLEALDIKLSRRNPEWKWCENSANDMDNSAGNQESNILNAGLPFGYVSWGCLGHSNDWSGCQMGCPTIARLAVWNFQKGTNPKSSSGLLPSSSSPSSSSSSSSSSSAAAAAATASSKKNSKNRCYSFIIAITSSPSPTSFIWRVSFQKQYHHSLFLTTFPGFCEIITISTLNLTHQALLQVVPSCLRCFAPQVVIKGNCSWRARRFFHYGLQKKTENSWHLPSWFHANI